MTFRRLSSLAVAAILSGAVIWHLTQHWSEFTRVLGQLGWLLWVGVGLLRLIAVVCAVAAARALLCTVTPRLSFSEYFLVSTASLFAAYVSPAGATLSKAVYLQQRHGLPLLHFGGLQITLLLFLTGGTALAALIGLSLLAMRDPQGLAPFWALAVFTLACSLLPFLGGLRPVADLVRRLPRLRPAWDAWHLSVRVGYLARRVLPWVVLRAVAGFVALGILFAGFTAAPQAFVVGGTVDGLTAMLNLVRITPGNLGPYEWAVSLLGLRFGVAMTSALAAALAYRLLALAASGAMALLILAWQGLRRPARLKLGGEPP